MLKNGCTISNIQKISWIPFWRDVTRTSILHYSKMSLAGKSIIDVGLLVLDLGKFISLAQGAGACGQLGHPDTSCLVKVRVGTGSKMIKHISFLKYGSSTYNIE